MDKTEIKKITHIIGERIFWTVQLLQSNNSPMNISDCEISFRGELNDVKTPYIKNFSRFDDFTVRFLTIELVNETADRKLEGRFYFKFPDGTIRCTVQILIVVKK